MVPVPHEPLRFTAGGISSRVTTDFIQTKLQYLIADMRPLTLTLQTLMAVQHQCATALAADTGDESLEDLVNGLSQHRHAELALEIIGVTEKDYFTRDPGLTEEEYAAMKNGLLTVGDVMQLRPEIFLAPVLRPLRLPH